MEIPALQLHYPSNFMQILPRSPEMTIEELFAGQPYLGNLTQWECNDSGKIFKG